VTSAEARKPAAQRGSAGAGYWVGTCR